MCTSKTSPLCRLGMPAANVVGLGHGAAVVQLPPPRLVAGTVVSAPLVNKPVELLPSPALLYRSNFTATLLLSPPNPRKLPPPPDAAGPTFWRMKVNPSATASVNWNVKSVVNAWTFTGVVHHPFPFSFCAVMSVSCKAVPTSWAFPSNCSPDAENPEPKLIPVLELYG